MSDKDQESSTSSEEDCGANVNEPQQNPTFNQSGIGGENADTSFSSGGIQPIQKRRRVTRACDECRRKKIKCDGKQPCTHCTVYSYQCTYDQPSNRRRNPAPQRVEALELRLRKAEALLKNAIPDANLDELLKDESPIEGNTGFQGATTKNLGPSLRANRTQVKIEKKEDENDSLLETMVDATGQLDIDDEGHPDFHGQSSGIVFLRKVREQFGDMMGQAEGFGKPFLKRRNLATQTRNPISANVSSSSMDTAAHPGGELPREECATLLCDIALNDACALMRFVHQPDFWRKFHHIYDTRQEDFGDAETKFLPLLYSVLALGTLFAKVAQSKLQSMGYEHAIQQGFGWFCVAREMINLTEFRDLSTIQTVLFMILYLQASSRLSTCYAFIGIVTRCAGLMGLHRSLGYDFNPIEQQIRKRVFWTIMKMDIYVGALLGLPMGIDDDEMDQDLPFDVDDEYITSDAIHPQPEGKLSLMCGCNAHTRLVFVLKKTMRHVYPIKPNKDSGGSGYLVSFAKVREIEEDLENWKESLPEPLRPGSEASPEVKRTQQLLRVAYAHIQIFLYRPFLHYATEQSQSKRLDKRCYGCAAACVNISRNTIHITTSMKDGGLLNGAYWFYMYTTFFAVLSLVYYVLANPKCPDSEGYLQDAIEGKDNLKALAKTSLAADRCTQTLAGLFEQLPGRWKTLRGQQGSKKKRSAEPFTPRATPRQAPKVPSKQSSNILPQHDQPPHDQAWTSPKEQLSAQWNHKMTQEPLRSQPGLSIDPTDFSGTSAPQLPSTTQSILRFQEQVPDFNMMMFPSQDPFAYPNPPITTLEANQIHGPYSPSSITPSSSDPSQSLTSNLSPTFDNLNPQAFGHLPPYLMQAQQPGMGFQSMDPNAYQIQGSMPNSASGGPSMMAPSPNDVGQTWDSSGASTIRTEQQGLTMNEMVAGRNQQQPWPGQGYGGQP